VSANTWYEVTLGTAATGATAGNRIAIVIGFTSYVSGNLRIGYVQLANSNFPRVGSYTGSTWGITPNLPITTLGYGGTYYPSSLVPISNVITRAFHSGSTPDESGNYFIPPVSMRVRGLWTSAYIYAGQSFDLVLYDSGNNALMTISPDSDLGATNYYLSSWLAATPVLLGAGQVYRVVQKPTSGSSTFSEAYYSFASSGLREAFPGCGGAQRTSRTDAGAWTTTNTELASCGIVVDQLEPSVRNLVY
jgi:hypothetical protein